VSLSYARLPAPWGIHPETLKGGRNLLQVSPPDQAPLLVCYCQRTHTAGLFYSGLQYWQMLTPLTFAQFLVMLGNEGIAIPESDDATAWIEACGLAPVATGRPH